MRLFRSNKNRAYGLPGLYPVLESVVANTQLSTPLCASFSLAMKSGKKISSCVIGLISIGGPSTVVGRISKRIIDSLNGVILSWARTHIGVKGLETIEPARADGNAASAIAHKILTSWITTSLFHTPPDIKFVGIGHSMRSVGSARYLLSKAATAFCVTAFERIAASGGCFATITHTEPYGILADLGKANNNQAPKTPAAQVFDSFIGKRGKLIHLSPLLATLQKRVGEGWLQRTSFSGATLSLNPSIQTSG